MPGACKPKIRRPNVFDKTADAADGITPTYGPC
jgi:hypothetical protein